MRRIRRRFLLRGGYGARLAAAIEALHYRLHRRGARRTCRIEACLGWLALSKAPVLYLGWLACLNHGGILGLGWLVAWLSPALAAGRIYS
jgi:hypothetical protein